MFFFTFKLISFTLSAIILMAGGDFIFNKNKFAEILQEVISQYDSISNFAEKSSLDRTYISKYVNKKLEHPPSPEVLKKISNNSKNITNYLNLMYVCDYLNDEDYGYLINSKSNINNYKIEHHFILIKYNKLNKIGQKKVNEYINDLIDTNKYNKEN